MATPKVPGDQNLFERVCFMLKLKVTKFQLHTHNGFLAVLKNSWVVGRGLTRVKTKPVRQRCLGETEIQKMTATVMISQDLGHKMVQL